LVGWNVSLSIHRIVVGGEGVVRRAVKKLIRLEKSGNEGRCIEHGRGRRGKELPSVEGVNIKQIVEGEASLSQKKRGGEGKTDQR